jgi:hypothetical protein
MSPGVISSFSSILFPIEHLDAHRLIVDALVRAGCRHGEGLFHRGCLVHVNGQRLLLACRDRNRRRHRCKSGLDDRDVNRSGSDFDRHLTADIR